MVTPLAREDTRDLQYDERSHTVAQLQQFALFHLSHDQLGW